MIFWNYCYSLYTWRSITTDLQYNEQVFFYEHGYSLFQDMFSTYNTNITIMFKNDFINQMCKVIQLRMYNLYVIPTQHVHV